KVNFPRVILRPIPPIIAEDNVARSFRVGGTAMLRLSWVWSVCAFSLVASLSPGQEAPKKEAPKKEVPVRVPPGVKFCPDLTYCQLKERELQLDLAYPMAGKGPFPAVVFFHGSGPLAKGRKFNLPQVLELADKGYVAVTVSYRHLP